mgnify:CR=1 FL=1
MIGSTGLHRMSIAARLAAVAAVTLAASTVIGVVLGTLATLRPRWIRACVAAYVEVFRDIPGEGKEPGEKGGKQGSKSGQDGKQGEGKEGSKSGQGGGKQGDGKEAGKSGQGGQQPVARIAEPGCFPRRVGQAGEIPVGVQAQNCALAEGGHDGRGLTV